MFKCLLNTAVPQHPTGAGFRGKVMTIKKRAMQPLGRRSSPPQHSASGLKCFAFGAAAVHLGLQSIETSEAQALISSAEWILESKPSPPPGPPFLTYKDGGASYQHT